MTGRPRSWSNGRGSSCVGPAPSGRRTSARLLRALRAPPPGLRLRLVKAHDPGALATALPVLQCRRGIPAAFRYSFRQCQTGDAARAGWVPRASRALVLAARLEVDPLPHGSFWHDPEVVASAGIRRVAVHALP